MISLGRPLDLVGINGTFQQKRIKRGVAVVVLVVVVGSSSRNSEEKEAGGTTITITIFYGTVDNLSTGLGVSLPKVMMHSKSKKFYNY
jgi:hypothetical protein